MQNVMALGRSRYLRRGDPLYPCGELADRHRAMCYKKQAGYALFARDGDVGAVFALCARVGRAFRGPCDEGLGTSVAVHHLKEVFADRDLRRLTLDACALGARRADRAACVAGAVRALINFDHGVRRAGALCAAAAPRLRRGLPAHGAREADLSGMRRRAIALAGLAVAVAAAAAVALSTGGGTLPAPADRRVRGRGGARFECFERRYVALVRARGAARRAARPRAPARAQRLRAGRLSPAHPPRRARGRRDRRHPRLRRRRLRCARRATTTAWSRR